MTVYSGDVSGVPYLVDAPEGEPADARVVVAWHMLDAPRSETALHAALPLDGLDAWKVYLGLPMSGSRLPDGGLDGFRALGARDAVRLCYDPVNRGAADEFGPAYDVLSARFGFGEGPLGLLGGSAGAGVATEVLARGEHDVAAVVLVSPTLQLRALVDAMGRLFGVTYPWDDETDAIAARMDYVARLPELPTMPIRLIVGEGDDPEAVLQPAMTFLGRFVGAGNMVTIENMVHALAEEPGLRPAPQTPHAAEVDREAVAWFRQLLR